MAGDWIKAEHVLPDKPEVIAIARLLAIDQDAVVGKLLRLWIWADQQTLTGNASSVTESFIDRCTFATGFAAAMMKVGWLQQTDDGLSLPNFDRHNGQTAKERALMAKRVLKHRTKRNAATVTESLPEKRREEKRREKEEKICRFQRPTVQDVAAYCAERGNAIDPERFVSHYESKGWKIGKSPMKNWKAAIWTWEKNDKKCSTGGTEDSPRPVTDEEMAHGTYSGTTGFQFDTRTCNKPGCRRVECIAARERGAH